MTRPSFATVYIVVGLLGILALANLPAIILGVQAMAEASCPETKMECDK